MDDDFATYARARHPGLVRLASLMLGSDRDDAEDLVQEALARVYSRWKQTRVDNLDAFVRRTMVNLTISKARRDRLGRTLLQRTGRATDDKVEPPTPLGESDVWAAVERLPARQRAVIVLRYYEDLDYHEIAEALRITPVTARTQCMRARDALRATLQNDYEVQR